jgi:hypothetical protein
MSKDLLFRWICPLIFPGIEANVKLIPKFHAHCCCMYGPLHFFASPQRFHFPSLYLPHLL